MKLILELDDKDVINMQGYCKRQGISVNELVTTLFNRYIQDPADVIDELAERNGNIDELLRFAKILTNYMNEAVLDIESLIGTEEEQDDDKVMANVFRKLNREHLSKADILIDLFKEYMRLK